MSKVAYTLAYIYAMIFAVVIGVHALHLITHNQNNIPATLILVASVITLTAFIFSIEIQKKIEKAEEPELKHPRGGKVAHERRP